MAKTIVITGATGFIGINLVKRFSGKEGYRLILFARNPEKARSLFKELQGVEVSECDQCSPESTDSALKCLSESSKDIFCIINLVGGGNVSSSSKSGYDELYNKNVTSTRVLLDSIIKSNISLNLFLHMSSISALGIQLDKTLDEDSEPKAATSHETVKLESEQIVKETCKKHHISHVILRSGMVYGEWDLNSEIPGMIRMVKKGTFPLIGGGNGLLPWVYVGNLMQAIERVLELREEKYNNIFIICDANPYRLNEIIGIIAQTLGKKRGYIYLPKSLVKLALFVIEPAFKLIGKEPPITAHRVDSFCGARRFNLAKALSVLGYRPEHDLHSAMPRVVRWYMEKGLV